jgi:DNA mismatch repair protein MutL
MIRKLPDHLIQMIAAGEVVDRPSSALKELIENSLDAGASEINVRLSEGGMEWLEVEDNGKGVSEGDLPLLFEPHATSKVYKVEDFMDLATLGFRGEALAALSHAAEVTFESSEMASSVSSVMKASFGAWGHPVRADKRLGSRVIVQKLFERMPARRAFLKSARAEMQACLQVFKRYCLAAPHVKWLLEDRDSKRQWKPVGDGLFERTLWYFDSQEPELWSDIAHQDDEWSLRLVFLKPRYRGRARSGSLFLLNGRPLKSMALEAALRRGFESFTEFPREMSAVVAMEGRSRLFDLHVHPTKQEVRFHDPDALFRLIVRALRESLESEHRTVATAYSEPRPLSPASPFTFESPGVSAATLSPQDPQPQQLQVQVPLFEKSAQYRYLGSIDHTYLLAEHEGALWLFDQHALHERVLYERLLEQWNRHEQLSSQRLLFPKRLEHLQWVPNETEEKLLLKLGFEVRELGSGTLTLIAQPAFLKRGAEEILQLLSESREKPQETLLKDVLSTMACHSAVRAHDVLERAEIDRLLHDFRSRDALGHCPHGRPTFIRFEKRDLEKLFHRVM